MSVAADRAKRRWIVDADGVRKGRKRPTQDQIRQFEEIAHYVLAEAAATAAPYVVDNAFAVIDDVDNTKALALSVGGITTATTRTWTAQDVSGTVYVSGGTDVPVTDGGTGSSTAAGARQNLGLGGLCSVVLASDSNTSTTAFNPFDEDNHAAFAVDADVAAAVGVTFTSTDGRFTVDTGFGGTWLVSATMVISPSAAGYVEAVLAVSGTDKITMRHSITLAGVGFGLVILGPVLIAAAAGDYVTLTLAPASGNVKSVTRSTFTMVRLTG